VKITKEYSPLLGKFIRKNTNFDDFGCVSPHFKSNDGKIWHEGAGVGLPPHAVFCNSSREYTPLGKIYAKNYRFWRFRRL